MLGVEDVVEILAYLCSASFRKVEKILQASNVGSPVTFGAKWLRFRHTSAPLVAKSAVGTIV
jgi:septum formation inhibitor-activating ATPase MinD